MTITGACYLWLDTFIGEAIELNLFRSVFATVMLSLWAMRIALLRVEQNEVIKAIVIVKVESMQVRARYGTVGMRARIDLMYGVYVRKKFRSQSL